MADVALLAVVVIAAVEAVAVVVAEAAEEINLMGFIAPDLESWPASWRTGRVAQRFSFTRRLWNAFALSTPIPAESQREL